MKIRYNSLLLALALVSCNQSDTPDSKTKKEVDSSKENAKETVETQKPIEVKDLIKFRVELGIDNYLGTNNGVFKCFTTPTQGKDPKSLHVSLSFYDKESKKLKATMANCYMSFKKGEVGKEKSFGSNYLIEGFGRETRDPRSKMGDLIKNENAEVKY